MKKLENHNTEYKRSWHDDCLKTICAFANTHGGTLYIGIDDKGHTKGVENLKQLLQEIPNKVENSLRFIPDVRLKKNKNGTYLAIHIKPHLSGVSLREKIYVRSGSNTKELKGVQLHRFLLEKSGQSWESMIEEGATLKDIDEKTILHFKELALKRFPIASKEKSTSNLLEKLGLLKKGKLTRAALLLFAKDPHKLFTSAEIKIGRFISDTDLQSTDVIEGNIFRQAEQAMEVLKNKYLVFNAHIEGLYRKEELEYPEEALREAILNAIIHKDYLGPHIQLRIYPDKLTLWNYGELPSELSIDRLKKQHRSLPRNKKIADVFYKAGLIESWGRGTIKIMEECKKAGLPEPLYEEEEGGLTITFRKDIYTEEQMKKMGLNERQIKAVLYLKDYRKITNTQYQKICKTSKRTASNDLQELSEKKIVEKIGTTGKGAQYLMQRGNKGAKGAKNQIADAIDKKLSLLEKDLDAINPNDTIQQELGKDVFFKIFDTWLSNLMRKLIPVAQRFNRLFREGNHHIFVVNSIGKVTFTNENVEDIIRKLREDCQKHENNIIGKADFEIYFHYSRLNKGGLKEFAFGQAVKIIFQDIKYKVFMDEFSDGKERNSVQQFDERLLHKPLTEKEINDLARKMGETLFEKVDYYTKKNGIR